MRIKAITLSAVVMVFALSLFIVSHAVAAPPEGEIKIIAPHFGKEIPVPRLESSHAHDWLRMLYDHLVGTTVDGKLSTELGLSKKWEMSPDARTWTFYLRKGVKFHDGVELTAKDVKFSIDQVRLPDSKSSYAGQIRKIVKSVEIKDPYTVVVHCAKPYLFLPSILSDMESIDGMIIPKDYYEKVGKDEFIKHPIGSGPYKWVSQMVGAHIKVEAAGKHWRYGVPKYKYATFLLIPEENTRIAMLISGEADVARISRESVAQVKKAGLNVVSKDGAALVMYHANMQWASPVFSDIRFRKALNLALDKKSMIKHMFGGLAEPVATYPGNRAFPCGGDSTLTPYPYDPVQAKRLIKEAGYEGHEFILYSYQRAGLPEGPHLAEAVAGYWQKIGLKPKIVMTEYSTVRKKWRGRKVENTIMGHDNTLTPGCGSILRRLRGKLYSTVSNAVCGIPELDAMFDKASSSLDMAEIKEITGEIYRYAYDNYLFIPIAQMDDEIATSKRIPAWDPGARRTDRNYTEIIRQR
jgi:ABC-type transport system substrate-binding protein